MIGGKHHEEPAIHVYFNEEQKDSKVFLPVLYGIEEEGIPTVIKKCPEADALKISYQAALDSILGIGIGIGADRRMVLHYTKLPKDRPLFQINQLETEKQRILGANAARLVKGIPFKSFDHDPASHHNSNRQTLTEEQLKLIVEMVVRKVYEIKQKGGTK